MSSLLRRVICKGVNYCVVCVHVLRGCSSGRSEMLLAGLSSKMCVGRLTSVVGYCGGKMGRCG